MSGSGATEPTSTRFGNDEQTFIGPHRLKVVIWFFSWIRKTIYFKFGLEVEAGFDDIISDNSDLTDAENLVGREWWLCL